LAILGGGRRAHDPREQQHARETDYHAGRDSGAIWFAKRRRHTARCSTTPFTETTLPR
jgi:hypothetical protein